MNFEKIQIDGLRKAQKCTYSYHVTIADKTFGISFPDSTQFITVNKYLHTIPSFPSQDCIWLGTVDTNDGILTVGFKHTGFFICKFDVQVIFCALLACSVGIKIGF